MIRILEAFKKQPLFLLSVVMLVVIVAFFAEIQGVHQPHVKSLYKRELFFLELVFVLLVLFNRQISFPDIRRLPRAAVVVGGFWLVWSFFTALNASHQPLLALYTYTEHLVLILFAFSVYALIQSSSRAREKLFWLILTGFAVFCLFFFWSYFLAGDYHQDIIFAWQFDHVGFQNIRHLGYYLTIGLVVATGIGAGLSPIQGNLSVWLGAILAILAWALIFWAGGRGPLVAFLGSLLIMVLFFGGVRENRRLLLFVAMTCFAGAGVSLLLPGGYGIDYLLDRLLWMPDDVSAMVDVEKTPSKRIEMWLACLGDIKSHPWFGIGQNNFSFGCGFEHKPALQPHGFHIQALLDWGIPGALSFVLFVGISLKHGYLDIRRDRASKYYILTPLWGVLMLLIFSLYDGVLFQRYSLMFFALFMVMMASGRVAESSGLLEKKDGRPVYLGLLLIVLALMFTLAINGYQFVVEYTEL